MRYAAKTKVPVNSSIGEIRQIVQRYGASAFAVMDGSEKATVMFEVPNQISGRLIATGSLTSRSAR